MKDLPNRNIICIDMKSFYASCIALLEGLDVMQVPIAVIANFEQPGSVVLAASPPMTERFRIKTGNRRFDIPDHPDIRLYEPKMAFFLEMSVAITKLIETFVPREAIHVYSIDECFVDLTGTEKLWGPVEDTAKAIQQAIYRQFHIRSAVGIGPNMLMAKLALDLEAKKKGFARWTYDDVKTKLWPVRPLSKMWGIGTRMEKNLNNMGIFSVGCLAKSDLAQLEQSFGIMGNQLYYHAWGIDYSRLGEPILQGQISFAKGQMLMRDYKSTDEIFVVILEMCEEVARRTRTTGFAGRTISLGISYSHSAMTKGFFRSKTIDSATNETLALYRTCKELFYTHFKGESVRQISIRLSNLEKASSVQLDLFDEGKEKRQSLAYTMDHLRTKYGASAILRAVSYTPAGTALHRQRLVGGHLA
ncbi:MAG: UV damage repair protein UvrX [Lysinibacillus sp.]